MIDFLRDLRQRKLVQWALAYLAAAFAIVQAADLVAAHFDWPASVVRYLILAFAVGFCVVLVLAWYHGERGAQRISGIELLIVALLLALGGAMIGYLGPSVIQQRATVAARSAPGTTASAAASLARTPHALPAAATAAPIPAKSIAVLPFENLASGKENPYFVSGMQDLILTKLAVIGDLKVISRTSTMKYRSRPDNLRKVAAELGVATLVEGSVQKQGNQVLINVQLIDARTDTHLWAETYTRTLDNVFGVEGEVAGKIASALHAKLSPALSARLAAVPTTNPQAYDLMLRSQYGVLQDAINGVPHDWNMSIALHRQAVALDPNFAQSWAWMSMAEEHVGALEPARKHALHALKLQPDLAIAHRALGRSYAAHGDDAAALKEYEKASALSPNDGYTLSARGAILLKQGHIEAAYALFDRAATLNPGDFIMLAGLGQRYTAFGHYAQAETWFRRALDLKPGSVSAKYGYAHAITFGNGDTARALALVQGDAPGLKPLHVELLTYQHKFRDALGVLESIPDSYFGPGGRKVQQQALIHWQAGEIDAARPLFAKALSADRADLAAAPDSEQANMLGVVGQDEIGVGHTTAGLATLAKSEAILDRAHDVRSIAVLRLANARGYVMAHRADLAATALAKALANPGLARWYAPVMLWTDPWWDPIRNDPRFVALLTKYAKYKPAAAVAQASL